MLTDAAPIIVSALFDPVSQGRLDALRRAYFPPKRNHLAAHLTLFHHLPPSIEDELGRRLGRHAKGPPPAARIADVMNLGRGTALRVEAPALATIRAELADAFADLLTPQDRAGWRPHVTLQNKVEPATAKALQTALEPFAPVSAHIIAIAAWRYRGGPWELIARHPFRG